MHGRPKPKSARNESYAHVEIVTVTIEVEIGYSNPAARDDAICAAKSLLTGIECGGAGRAGSYNAVAIDKPQVRA